MLLFAGALIALIGLIIALIAYVLMALGTYHVLKKLDFAYPWLAWIPVAQTVALGLCCKEEDNTTKIMGYSVPNIVVALMPVIAIVVAAIHTLLYIVVCVIGVGTIYSIIYAKMENKQPQETVVLGFISGFLPIIAVVKFLIYKFKK